MKTAPHLAVGLTACVALAGGFVLATEDRALFDPRQAQLLVWIDDAQSVTPMPGSFRNEAFAFPQAASPAARATKH